MNKQGINKSVLAALLASSSTVQAAVALNANTDVRPQVNNNVLSSPKIYSYGLNTSARYKDEKLGYLEGKIFLNIKHSNRTPSNSNKITAEYEGQLYFMSNSKVGNYELFIPIGGEDGNVILDLINEPNRNNSSLPSTFNIHGCNSTITACSPLELQLNVFKNGAMTLSGRLSEKVDVLYHGQWANTFYDMAFVSIPSQK